MKHRSTQTRVLTETKRKLIKHFLLSEADLWRVEHAGYSLALPPLILSPLIANDPLGCVQVPAMLANKLNQHPANATAKKRLGIEEAGHSGD